MEDNEDYFTYKIAIIGDEGVGKSSILSRFLDNSFSKEILSAVGLVFRSKAIEKDNLKIGLLIRDASGKEEYQSKIFPLLKDLNGCILVYDITNEASFNNVVNWKNKIVEINQQDIPMILVGNKCDLNNERKIHNLQGEQKATILKCSFLESSASTPTNIDEIFMKLIDNMLEFDKKMREKEEESDKKNITEDGPFKLEVQKKYKDDKKCCC